jgi:hypothetical protein
LLDRSLSCTSRSVSFRPGSWPALLHLHGCTEEESPPALSGQFSIAELPVSEARDPVAIATSNHDHIDLQTIIMHPSVVARIYIVLKLTNVLLMLSFVTSWSD